MAFGSCVYSKLSSRGSDESIDKILERYVFMREWIKNNWKKMLVFGIVGLIVIPVLINVVFKMDFGWIAIFFKFCCWSNALCCCRRTGARNVRRGTFKLANHLFYDWFYINDGAGYSTGIKVETLGRSTFCLRKVI